MKDLSLGLSSGIYESIYSKQIDNLERNIMQG